MNTAIDAFITEAQHTAEHALIEWTEPYVEKDEVLAEGLEELGEDQDLIDGASLTTIFGESPIRNFVIKIDRCFDIEVIIKRDTGESFAENYEVATFTDHNDPQIEAAIEEAKALCAERLVWELHHDLAIDTPPEHLDF